MVKKRGAVKRAEKRGNEAAAELLDQTIDNQETARFEAKEDSELFILDKAPDASKSNVASNTNAKKRHFKTTLNVKQTKRNRISANDEIKIKKILNNHSSDKVISLAAGNEKRLTQRRRSKRIAGTAKTTFDLWGETSDKNATKIIAVKSGVASAAGTAPIEFKAVSKISLRKDIQQPAKLSSKQLKMREMLKEKKRKAIQVELAQPGQSYRPDEEQHQDLIGEALSIELRRKEAIEYNETPISDGMNPHTLSLLVGSSDEESSDDEDDDDNDTNSSTIKPLKRKEKFTRAQRNKQKRVKALQVQLKEKKRVKQLLNSLQDAKRITKEMRKKDAELVARKDELNVLKEEEFAKPLGVNVIAKRSQLDPINAPSLPVALTEELKGGSLRTVKPKGSLLTDRLESMISRKMANKRNTDNKKRQVHGKKRRMKGGKGRDFLLS
jgi:nucleolar protein 53